MQPEIDLFGLPLKSFGLLFALAFVASGAMASRRLRELGKPVDWAYEATFAALIGGLVGAKVYWAIEHSGDGGLFSNLFSGTGLTFYGGLLGGAAGVLLWARWRGFLGRTLLDLAAAPIAIGYAVGRLGCQISGDGDYGKPWDGPWAMAYPDGTVPTDVAVHPTPLYETLTMGLVTYALWRLRDSFRPGVLFGLYLLLAGTERFVVEFVRRNDPVAAGLTLAQLESVVVIIGGALWLWILAREGPLRLRPGVGRSRAVPA